MATITPIDPRRATGAAPSPANASGGGDVVPMLPGRTYLLKVNNGGGAGITMDIDDPVSGSGNVEYDDVPIGAGASRVFAFKRPLFGKTPTENVALSYSAVTSVTVEAYGPLD